MTVKPRVCRLVAVALLLASAAGPGQAAPPQPLESPEAAASWHSLFERDLDDLIGKIRTNYIYASYPTDPAWQASFARSIATARKEAALVKDFASYRAILQHFVVSFEDAHFSAYFNVVSRRTRWPGFDVEYRGGAYVVALSERDDVPLGAKVTACDSEPLNTRVDRLTEFLGGPKGLDTTRGAISRTIFIDEGNPLYRVPQTCSVDGREVKLEWRDVPPSRLLLAQPERTMTPRPTLEDNEVGVRDFGANAAWVRIGTMMPTGKTEVERFRALIARAPSLRTKKAVVIDVRGNSGGVYNWFMAFLRAFYGADYADYYARARLEIENVMMTPPGAPNPKGGVVPGFNMSDMPPDPPMERAGKPTLRKLPDGGELVINPAPVASINYPAQPPANPVLAKVYLLADFGCASACISFVDELRRFPGVIQVGTETHVDRRSGGWPEAYPLPSGLALVRMGRMVRQARKRGENETWRPTIRFDGDISDTPAVEKWVRDTVLAK